MARKTKHPSWSRLSDEEKAAYLQEARHRGGLTRCAQESMCLARSKGWQSTVEKYPFASGWLKKSLKAHNQRKADELNVSVTEYRFQRQRTLHFIYIRLSE